MTTALSWATLRNQRVTVPEHVAHRTLAHETVLLNVTTSTYFSLDEIGGRFFEVLRSSRSVQDAQDALSTEYSQPADRIAADITAFVEQLRHRGLIVLEVSRTPGQHENPEPGSA